MKFYFFSIKSELAGVCSTLNFDTWKVKQVSFEFRFQKFFVGSTRESSLGLPIAKRTLLPVTTIGWLGSYFRPGQIERRVNQHWLLLVVVRAFFVFICLVHYLVRAFII